MQKSNEIRRIDSILRLQKKLHALTPGTYLFEIYDKAIDLAMNDTRKIDEYFYYNLIRDSRRILSRRKHVAPAFYTLLEPDHCDNDVKEERNPFISDYFTPEQFVIHTSLVTSLQEACKSIHKYAQDILNDMVDGLTIKDSSKKRDLSESLVKKLRVEIKSLSKKILFN